MSCEALCEGEGACVLFCFFRIILTELKLWHIMVRQIDLVDEERGVSAAP